MTLYCWPTGQLWADWAELKCNWIPLEKWQRVPSPMWPIVCLADMPGSKGGSFCKLKGRWSAEELPTINCPSLDMGGYN